MASTEKLLRIVLKLEDQFSKDVNKAADSFEKLGNKMTSIGKGMTAALTLPIATGFTAMFKSFADFETVMAELGARTGATADEMKQFSDLAIKMGRDTAFSATEAAQALLELASSGMSAAQSMETLPHVLNLAAAGGMELGRAADGLTDILAAFGLQAKDAADVTDFLTKAAGASSATVESMVDAFANVAPVLKTFGISMEEGAAAIAILHEAGIKGAESGTQLRSMLLNMTRDVDEVQGAWKKLGVELYDAQGNFRDIDDIFKDINKAFVEQNMTMEEQIDFATKVAGSYGIVGFQSLLATNGINGMQAAMANAAGAEEVAAARMNTLAGRFDSLMGSVETLGIVLGGLAVGPLNDLIVGITNTVNAFADWAALNPQLAQTGMIILGIVAALGPVIAFVGQLIGAFVAVKGAILGVAAAFPALAAGFGAVMAVLAPFIPLIIAVVAASALLWAVATNFMGVRDAIANAAGTIIQWVKNIGEGWGIIATKASEAFDYLKEIVWNALNSLSGGMLELGRQVIEGLINGIKSKAVDLVAYVFGLSNELTAAIKSALGIRSPSKVMMEMGENVVAGFHKGIESMGGVGVTVPRANAMPTVSASPALAAARMGGGGGGTQIYNVYAAPGSTDQQVRDIAKKLGRMSKKRGAKGV